MKNNLIASVLLLVLTACKPLGTVPYATLAGALTNLNTIAQLDGPATQMICSYDRSGANEDYNHFQGRTKDGQVILADLKGPGVMTRLWFTGIKPDRKFRFCFDGEKTPRFEFSWDELRAGVPPFNIEPLSVDEQNCWYTLVPVPFKKRLLITTDDAGYVYGKAPKMYYQLNWNPMPVGQTVESLSPQDEFQSLEKVSNGWKNMDLSSLPTADEKLNLSTGETVELWSGQGPATVQAFTIELGIYDSAVLRNLLLKIYWDGSTEPSVAVPLGDFFGSVNQRWRAQSMFFGSVGNTFFCRFPMPFKTSARIVLENQSGQSVDLKFGVQTGSLIDGGYFHAGWRNSGANETGTPHTVLKTSGRGRYVGCILSVNSADRSFWVLESDESMVIDGVKIWQGTGLEDYFNAGWYYGNVFARPLHGLLDKVPFRTVQYRLHLTEPVLFDQNFKMDFERGPNHASHAAYESVSFYYIEQPQAADSRLANRAAPTDPLRQYTLMIDLWNFERFGDLRGEAEFIDRYIEQYNPPFADVLKARAQACRYELGEGNLDNAPEVLQRLYTEESAALVQLYCNMSSDLYLDGEKILSGGDPKMPVSKLVELKKGRHVLAVSSGWQEYPKWTQVAVRTAAGFLIGTSKDWKHAVNPSGNWAAMDYDDSAWVGFKNYDGRVKGPPEEPYLWVKPDPFINTLSQASGLRPSAPWGSKKGRVVYRKVFEIE